MRRRSGFVSPAVGSSRSSSVGSSASTIASSSDCFSPCERCRVSTPRRSDRPVARTTSSADSGKAIVDVRRNSDGRSMRLRATRRHSATVMVSNTVAVWNLRPTPSAAQRCGGMWRMLWPPTSTVPALRSRPSAMQRISVVLPAPFGPIRLTRSPAWAVNSTPRST